MRLWPSKATVITCVMGIVAAASAASGAATNTESKEIPALFEAARVDEQRIEASGLVYHDHDLETYLNRVAARLTDSADSAQRGFQVKVLKDPLLNAFTYPNGVVFVNSGILARLENESQLAALLAHELAHYIHQHAAKGIRQLNHQRPEGGSAGQADTPSIAHAQRNLQFAWSGYRQEAEFEADREGLRLMADAGYEPRDTLRLFSHLAEEMARENLKEPLFFATHPRLQTRIDACVEYLTSLHSQCRPPIEGQYTFAKKMQDLRLMNIQLDIQAGRLIQARRAAERYLALSPEDARAHFLLGEVHRQLSPDMDETAKAESCYKRAIDLDTAYADPHRALGLMYFKAGLVQRAREHLEASLALTPDAPENAYVRYYLNRMPP